MWLNVTTMPRRFQIAMAQPEDAGTISRVLLMGDVGSSERRAGSALLIGLFELADFFAGRPDGHFEVGCDDLVKALDNQPGVMQVGDSFKWRNVAASWACMGGIAPAKAVWTFLRLCCVN
jgi:hypothetical protein